MDKELINEWHAIYFLIDLIGISEWKEKVSILRLLINYAVLRYLTSLVYDDLVLLACSFDLFQIFLFENVFTMQNDSKVNIHWMIGSIISHLYL